jgi:hypothetical protein
MFQTQFIGGPKMVDLKIRTFKHGSPDPSSTVTIPGGIIKVASGLIPRVAREAMLDEGIDLDEIARAVENPEVRGILAQIEDNEKDEQIVISLE